MAPRSPTVAWIGAEDGHLELIDQTRLPGELVILQLDQLEEVWEAIFRLSVRGAPAIGVAAAYGLFLGIRGHRDDEADLFRAIDAASKRLAASRPTAVNLFWALSRMEERAAGLRGQGVEAIASQLLSEAHLILEEDRAMCRRMGEVGAALVEEGDGLLTHCNAGALATADFGTALGVFFKAQELGKSFRVFADETRPLLQGARLTTWELMRAGIDVTLICDNAAARVFSEGKIQRVFVGSDRIARNGDVCNKIGTYGVALIAKAHGVPFYAVAPTSTFDLDCPSGEEIPIEERAPEEVTEGFGRRTAPEGVKVYSPAFDVTPASLVAGIVTEKGLISPVDEAHVVAMVNS